MFKLKTIALAAAASAGLFLAVPATSGAAPLSPPGHNASGESPIVEVAQQQRKWRKRNFNNRRADRRRHFNNRRYSNRGWRHGHRNRGYGWGGGYYRPYYSGYRRPYCGYGWNSCYGYNGYGYGGYGGYGYGSPGVNLIFRF